MPVAGQPNPPPNLHPRPARPERAARNPPMINSPYIRKPASVQSVMLQVLLALVPGIAAYVWFFGAGILVQLAIASAAALAGEAAMLAIRGKPKALFLTDLSAIVTAWLIALTFPPIVPWWLTVTGTLLAVVIVKQLYGGLGQNPFNPAMAAFCLMIVAYPALMSQWPAAGQLDFKTQLDLIFGGARQQVFAHGHRDFCSTVHGGHQLVYLFALASHAQQISCLFQVAWQGNFDLGVAQKAVCLPQHAHCGQCAFFKGGLDARADVFLSQVSQGQCMRLTCSGQHKQGQSGLGDETATLHDGSMSRLKPSS